MITFRLADALPSSVVEGLNDEMKGKAASLQKRVETYLDAGYGACLLRDPAVADVAERALLSFDGVRYHLLAWVVMPNHVHVLIETLPGYGLSNIVHSWKSFTAKAANRILKRGGTFWQREYFDRAIRDERHLISAVVYIHDNPCRAGLVGSPEEWRLSSASGSRR